MEQATAPQQSTEQASAVRGGVEARLAGLRQLAETHPALNWLVKAVTPLWMPWSGKRFNAAASTGDNRLVDSARIPSKLIWPRYESREAPDSGRLAFDFETRVEPGEHDPDTQVLVID